MIHDYKVDQASETGLFLPSRFHPYPAFNQNDPEFLSNSVYQLMGTPGRKKEIKHPADFFLSISRKKAFCAREWTPRRVSSFPLELLLILGSPLFIINTHPKKRGQREYSQSNVVWVHSYSVSFLFFFFDLGENLCISLHVKKHQKKGKCYIQQDPLTIYRRYRINMLNTPPPQTQDASRDKIWSLDTKYRNPTVVWDFVRRSAIWSSEEMYGIEPCRKWWRTKCPKWVRLFRYVLFAHETHHCVLFG